MTRFRARSHFGRVAMVLALIASGAVSAGEEFDPSKPFDRSQYFDDRTETSDDLRRVPIRAGEGAPEGAIVIRNARLFDGTGAPARLATLVISGKTLTNVLPPDSSEGPKDAQQIDAAGKTVIPGLIDLHTHLTYVTQFGLPVEISEHNQADAVLRGVERLRYYVESGITSVRDLASHGMAPFMLKKWVAGGRIPGPRVFAAGQLIVGVGGHGTEGYNLSTAPSYPDGLIREATGADDWRAAVRQQFKNGADVIKLSSHFDEVEVRAAVEEAHALGLRVSVDSETIFTKLAVEAGADCIEHPMPRSDEVVRLMAKRGVCSVPTIFPLQYISSVFGGYFGSTSRRFTISDATVFGMVRKMKQAGVKLGVGTDLVLDWYRLLPEPYIQELKNFERVGYSAAEALVAATKTNAEILGMADRLGTLEPGKLADLVLIDGKPDLDAEALRNVSLVIVNGRIVVRDGRIYVPRHEPKKWQLIKGDGQ